MSLWERTQSKLSICWVGKEPTAPVGHLFRTYDVLYYVILYYGILYHITLYCIIVYNMI